MLERNGIDPTSILSKGHASKVIDTILRRRQSGLCTLKQMSCLNRMGYPNAETTTFQNASILIARGMAA
jgi:hypothetical protein